MRTTLLAVALGGCSSLEDFEQKPGPPPTTTATTPTTPPPDCDAYSYLGETYDCSALDRCTEQDFQYRMACCECDPTLCDPDPNCTGGTTPPPPTTAASSCMVCHNGSTQDDYLGPGISNPHPFGGTAYLACETCHGGDPAGLGKTGAHVPPPPQIGDRFFLTNDQQAYFNYLTRTGIDKFPDWTVDGVTYTATDYLQFENPGDLRVVTAGRGCGTSGCHSGHSEWFPRGFIGNETGFYSATLMATGADNHVPENEGLYDNTSADVGFRARTDPTWVYDPQVVGPVARVIEPPVYAAYGDRSGFYQNQVYTANTMANSRDTQPDHFNQVLSGSPLEELLVETVVFQCGDCHAGSSGQNNRYADFRSSGCTVCHMAYSKDGRSRSTDPNVRKDEPFNPDAIAAPERPHVESHQIRNVAKVLPNGAFVRGITDDACVGCHQGSNRTVLQYWGIRLDQNQDVVNGFQYPANPVTFTTTQNDTRLFDPAVANATFNGRNFNQYLLTEDYDGDNKDDTPPDVHYEAGLGCIDCHSSRDLHNGADSDPTSGKIWSRMEQTVGVECESCHGTVDDVAATIPCDDYTGAARECFVDRFGNPLRNTYVDTAGDTWLVGRIDGARHYVPQIRYAVVQTQRNHPLTGQALFDRNASYAMGVADGTEANGIGPLQNDPNLFTQGFSHMDKVGCDGCHVSWINNCEGCHVQTQYNDNPNNYFFSNTTGERITLQVTNADFTYIIPNWFTMEVTPRGKIGAGTPGMKNFYRYVDLNGDTVAGVTFSTRNGMGSNPNYGGAGAFPALLHNYLLSHSIRGKQTGQYEGEKECVACHLNQAQLANFDANGEYTQYFADIEDRNYAGVDFALLQTHLGLNTNNALNSPYYVHMASGLGTGMLLADQFGCPINPLDQNANRFFCQNGAPADNFDLNNVVYDEDKVAELTGGTNAGLVQPQFDATGVGLRNLGHATLAGPMSPALIQTLADPTVGLVLDGWIDANGAPQGSAANFVQ